MNNNNKMDIHLTLGSQQGLLSIADTNLTVTSNPNIVQNIIAQSKYHQDTANDPILVLHFYVQQGKEKQAIAYINEALDQTIEQDSMSPMQKLLRRPSQSTGSLQIIENPGCIVLNYRFNAQKLEDQDSIQNFQQQFEKFDKVTFKLNSSLKGGIKHNNNNRTNVKVDYVDVHLYSDEISPSDFTKLMKVLSFEEDEMNFLMTVPAFQMIGNLRSAQFQAKLASFRQLRAYYIEAAEDEKLKQKENKPFPYVNRGIFRNQVSIFSIFKNKIAVKFDSHYNGQDVLMRLLKVSLKFWHQIK